MTLTPESRVLLTDALRPPAGYQVDVAVATTYSLNLTALLLAPLSFALVDQTDSDDIRGVDPIRLLEAVRRYAQHTTVFCQAGGIGVPSNYRSILTFVEDSVLEVMPPHPGSMFHPKIWALRFVDQDGRHSHRLLVLSRNMTLDASWDTALVLDETESGEIDAGPAGDFVRRLSSLSIVPLNERRAREIDDLADTLGAVRLALPSPYAAGSLLPIGLTEDKVWPFPDRAAKLLAISPFLTWPALRALARVSPDRTLVSRAEALEMVGARALDGWKVNVLQRLVEVDVGDDVTQPSAVTTEMQGTNEGLHAKTFILDLGRGRSMLVTGSANLTGETWGGSVEFDAVLTGPTAACGVGAVLDGSADVPGLNRLLEAYTVADDQGVTDPTIETSYAIERFHQQLAVGLLDLHVSALDHERVVATLTLKLPVERVGSSVVWLASLPEAAHGQPLAPSLTWGVAPINVTPFIAVETTAGEGDARITRRCVLKATLSGAVDGRRHDAVFSILRSKQDVLRYLAFLLGDPGIDAFEDQGGDSRSADGSAGWTATADVVLFEPLVRATGRDQDALARVASLVEELRELPNGADLVPDGFDQLWDVVWQVHQEPSS